MFASRIGDRIQDLVDIEQGRLLQQGATVLLAQRREDNSFCDRIHRQLLLEISGSVLSYLISWEKSLSAIIHRPWVYCPYHVPIAPAQAQMYYLQQEKRYDMLYCL